MPNTAPSLEDLYDALDNEAPLDIDHAEDRALYVADLHKTEGPSPVEELIFQIKRNKSPGAWYFTGHRGVGKSTELRRVAHELRQAGHVAVVADMGEYLNLAEEISIELLLLTMMAALSEEVERLSGGDPLVRGYFIRLKDYFTRTQIDIPELTAGVDAAGGKLSAKAVLKNNPTLREKVVGAVRESLGTFSDDVEAFADEMVGYLKKDNPHRKVVLILDSLERLRFGGVGADKRYEAIQRTFDTYAEHLKFKSLNVVYSIPPYLPHLVPKLGSYFGVNVCTLPHVKVFERPKAAGEPARPCGEGVRLMKECLSKRYPLLDRTVDPRLTERLIQASSGSPREFFRLMRTLCTKAILSGEQVPMGNERWAQAAEQELRNEMPLAEADIHWLKKVRASNGTGLDKIENLSSLARLFDSGLILGYRNSEDWCDVHWLLRHEVDAYQPPES